ncbi:HAMP domain-containing histidine kinase (plasmid) [Photobacterium sp. GJ3]|uniref:sensor histidine kinase n=1 Tax=Photobacterium sp. GJ3 TaxID=2829502 RepID=UPI001B8BCD11|nr:HAMP domain-containing sensor histidine kinase [Photobacterium sp. GJ3]QUJ69872.1 HAMP domain-containing histidine kinase [Photobacterium sp. GJ3]
MSSNLRAESASRQAQRTLFLRFLATVLACFLLVIAAFGWILAYQADAQERKLLDSIAQEYQRILKFESDAKLEHVVVSNPNRLIENALSVVRAEPEGLFREIGGARFPKPITDPARFQPEHRHWYHLFSDKPFLSHRLEGQPLVYWLLMDGTPKRNQLITQMTWLAAALTIMVIVMAWFVWRLLHRTLSPLHHLAKQIDQFSGWSLDAMLLAELPEVRGNEAFGQLSQSVRQVMNRLKETVKGMDNTVDAIAHDVRTPLSRILLTTEAALGPAWQEQSPDEQLSALHSALSDCAESADQASRMLTTLMRIHDEQIGRHTLHPQALDLAALMSEVATWYEEVAEAAEIRLDLSGLTSTPVISEPSRLTQIVVNLLDNSIKYSLEGSAVQLACGRDDQGGWLSVTDQGVGIAPEHQTLIFRRLYRVESSRHQPGYGLGLSMVAAMVSSLQGKLELHSVLGEGSRFTVRLPGAMTQGLSGNDRT